jgi:hypothetical protein
MSKLYWIVVIVVCGLALWVTEDVFSQDTTIILPDGSIVRCIETVNGIVSCL